MSSSNASPEGTGCLSLVPFPTISEAGASTSELTWRTDGMVDALSTRFIRASITQIVFLQKTGSSSNNSKPVKTRQLR